MKAADAARCSISAELEKRLQWSFSTEKELQRQMEFQFGGPDNHALGYLVARIAVGVSNECREDWIVPSNARIGLANALREFANRLTHEREPFLQADIGGNQSFELFRYGHAVLDKITAALSAANSRHWWPLWDGNETGHAPNFRPKIDALRKIWPWPAGL